MHDPTQEAYETLCKVTKHEPIDFRSAEHDADGVLIWKSSRPKDEPTMWVATCVWRGETYTARGDTNESSIKNLYKLIDPTSEEE